MKVGEKMTTVPVITDISEFNTLEGFLNSDFPKESYCRFTLSEGGTHYRYIFFGASISGVKIYRTDNLSEASSLFGTPTNANVCYYFVSNSSCDIYQPQYYESNNTKYTYYVYTSQTILFEGVYATAIAPRNTDFVSVDYIGEFATIPIVNSIYDIIQSQYPITYHYTNSTVSGPSEAAVGDIVTVSAVPDVGYGITDASTQILVTNDDVAVPYTWDAINQRVTFTMPQPATNRGGFGSTGQ